ncbi:MAG: transposase [Candidatus Omnitrophica bacterium]|nr:transposase [Candidatus Omnitrophota bacterium]MCM8800080.1 transposase [Candidatus Omnitrophota bacterium]
MQQIFYTSLDYKFYLKLLERYSQKYSLSILSFCLMPNHVHFICVPSNKDSLANTFKNTHMVYAQYLNNKRKLKGHLWQGRFFSSILDERYLYAAIRYVERNPVRAGLVEKPWDWLWSSACAHVGIRYTDLSLGDISKFIKIKNWIEYLIGFDDEELIKTLKKNTLLGRPSVDINFIDYLERMFGIKLTFSKRSRPVKKNSVCP